MDIIDKSQKTLYEKCKYKVKLWEHTFKKANGRLPSRLDIKEAEAEVRNAYKTYFQLKTAALEQSFMGVDGFNSDEEQSVTETIKLDQPTTTTEVGAKIHESSPTIVNDSNTFTWGPHLNKTPVEKHVIKPMKPLPNLNLKITKKLSVGSKLIKRNPRKSLSQVKSESSINSCLPSTISELEHEKPTSFSQPTETLNFNPENTLELESSHGCTVKNMKIMPAIRTTFSQPVSIIQKVLSENVEKDLKYKDIDIEWLERVESSAKINSEATKVDFISDEDIIDKSDDETSKSSSHIVKKIKYNNGLSSSLKTLSSSEKFNGLVKSNSFETKVKQNDINSQDLKTLKEIPVTSSGQCSENIQNIKQDKVKDGIESESSEKRLEGNQDVTKLKIKEYDDELMTKLKSKNLNENFVRINMKKKIYARGKKTQTFSKYKRSKWKSKQKFLAEASHDNLKGKSYKLLPLDATACSGDEDSLVTLNQAAGRTDIVQVFPTTTFKNDDSDDDNMTLAQIKKSIEANIDTTEVKHTESNSKSSKIPNRKKATSAPTSKTNQVSPDTTKTKQKSKEAPAKPRNKNVKKSTSVTRKPRGAKQNSEQINKNNEVLNKSASHTEEVNDNVNEHLFDADDDLDLLLETVRLENRLNIKGVYPLYIPNEDESLIETPQEVFEALRSFGHQSFREGQEQTVMRILSGKSTLVTLSTGSGKSLCYQLPAYLFRKKYRCITLVVSPLISLMEDQIKCGPAILNAACLHGNMSKTQRDKIKASLEAGEISVLIVSPESILSCENSSGFGSILAQLPPIAFACLDEAHCLSQWSHNFRPSYLVVCRILQEFLGVKTILGLTATATKITRRSLIDQLKIPDGENGVIRDTPVPPNLSLSVSKDANRERALLDLLLSEPFVDFQSVIIYCLRRDECEKVAAFLRSTLRDQNPSNPTKKRKRMSLQAEAYHAGLSGARRKTVQNSFMSGELRIVVATIAFGMGINKPDLRSVIHYNMPAKFESYVQEIGRAGRDGLPAHCHVFLDNQNADVFELRRHIYGNSVDRHIIRKLLRKVFISCNCKGTCLKHEVVFSMDSTVNALDVQKEIISTLLCYLELHKNKYIKILKPSYAKCKILSYGGRALIDKVALTCEPLKLALKMYGTEDKETSNTLEFPILNIARALNYDTGMCKSILKNLEWTNVNGEPKRSGLTVELSDLSFHLLSPGNLPDEDLDEVLDSLYKKVIEQENSAYSQLIHINKTLTKVASPTFRNCLIDNEERSEQLKEDIREYFESDKQLDWVDVPEVPEVEKGAIVNDIRSIIGTYSDESFTGRSIARIFHGISSPNFPPYVWGRTRYWRSHLRIHFNNLCKIATSELVKLH